MGEQKLICHISYNHSAYDDRIYWKEILSLKKFGYDVVHLLVGDTNEDFISPEGIRIITIQRHKINNKLIWLKRFLYFFFNSITIKQLFKKAKEINADLYHYHDLQINGIVKKLKNLHNKPKLIYDSHEAYHLLLKENTPTGYLKSSFYATMIKLIQRWELKNSFYADAIIVTDDYTFNYFKNKFQFKPIHLLYNYSFFQPYENDDKEIKLYHFIYCGLLNKQRGIFDIISTIVLVKRKMNNVKVLLIGPFEKKKEEKELLCKIDELHLNENVIVHAPVPFNEMSTFYKRSLIGLGLFHNTPKYSTFIPIKLFEYMAFGLPVIFSNHGPSAKIIKGKECGLLVEAGNTKQISAAMKKLLLNQNIYNDFKINAKRAVSTEFNWLKEEEKLMSIYHDVFNYSKKLCH